MMLILAVLAVLSGPSWASSQHQVVDKDHLWGLAGKYYGNNFCWRAIYEANKDSIKDPHWIYPRQDLVIPESPKCGSGAEGEPVEASAPVTMPAEIPAPAEEPATVQEPAADPAPAPAVVREPLRGEGLDDVMAEIPKGQSGSSVSTPRMEFAKGWKGDGVAVEELLAESSDEFHAKMSLDQVPAGSRFTVYRRAPRLESDGDKKAVFVVRIGAAEALRHVKRKVHAFKLLRAGEAVAAGDILKLEQ